VLTTTQAPAGTGLLMCNGGSMNSQVGGKVSWGNVTIRQGLTMRVGYSGTDLTQNLLRFVQEERLNVAVERPTALCAVTGLPTGALGGGS
jgi:hypothetical protein